MAATTATAKDENPEQDEELEADSEYAGVNEKTLLRKLDLNLLPALTLLYLLSFLDRSNGGHHFMAISIRKLICGSGQCTNRGVANRSSHKYILCPVSFYHRPLTMTSSREPIPDWSHDLFYWLCAL